MIKRWYAVYTKKGLEKKVAEVLNRKNIESYCPLNRIAFQNSEGKTIQEPLFASHVFVNATEQQLNEVKKASGIINVMYWFESPAVIKDEEIKTIKYFLKEYKSVYIEPIPVNIEENVQVVEGSFVKEGDHVTLEPNIIKANLPSLGFSLVTNSEKAIVEIVKVNSLRQMERSYN